MVSFHSMLLLVSAEPFLYSRARLLDLYFLFIGSVTFGHEGFLCVGVYFKSGIKDSIKEQESAV